MTALGIVSILALVGSVSVFIIIASALLRLHLAPDPEGEDGFPSPSGSEDV